MSYMPIDFENLPSKETPVSAENLNYIQQGVILAVDRSRALDEAWKDGSLKGDKGDRGVQGERGLQGVQGVQGVAGRDGRNFEIDGIVALLDDLPPASEHNNQIWLTNQYGHLHFSNGTDWLDWGQFTGLQGEQGEQGIQGIQGVQGERGADGILDVESLTPAQLQQLYKKLESYHDIKRWHYKTDIVQSKTSKIPLGDLNLTLDFTNYGTTMMTYKVVPIDTTQPATYYIKRLSNYDLVAWEGTASSGYTPQAVTASGFVLDGSAYYAGREDIKIGIVDVFNGFWYTIEVFGAGLASNILIDVTKRAVQGRIVVDAV